MSPSPRSTDILAAIFFVLAGAWLIIAILYSFLVLCFLRMRARGQLDSIYDEDFGRVYLFGGNRYYVPLGWIFRRYLIHLQREQGRASSRRFMTRAERRMAMEQLLTQKGTNRQFVAEEKEEDENNNESESSEVEEMDLEEAAAAAAPQTGREDSSLDAPLCCICLGNYEEGDTVLHSGTCSHQFHQDCILDWLERQANTDCPCCRVPLVSEEDVWKNVKRLRKERRKDMRKTRSEYNLEEQLEHEEPTENETESSDVGQEQTSPSDPSGSLEGALSSEQTKGDDLESPALTIFNTTSILVGGENSNFRSHSLEI